MNAESAVKSTSALSSGDRETRKEALSISWELLGSAGMAPACAWSRLAWSRISCLMDSGKEEKVS